MLRLVALALALASGTACQSHRRDDNGEQPQPRVVFATARGDIAIAVEIAATAAEQQRGLMFRRELAPDHGMLFVFDGENARAFWMKNTYIPLDMIFISAKLTVVGVIADAEPLSEKSLAVATPAQYVLEINAGQAQKLGVTPGTRVRLALEKYNARD